MLCLLGTMIGSQKAMAWNSKDSTSLINYVELSVNGSFPFSNEPVQGLPMKDRNAFLLQLSIGHQFSKSDFGPSRRRLNYPAVGLSLTYIDCSHVHLRQTDEATGEIVKTGNYGRFLAAAFDFTQYHWRWGNNWRVRSSLQSGAAYSFYPHKLGTDQEISDVGGRFQAYFSYGLFACYDWGGHEIALGPQYTHVSNSNTSKPNCGINMMGVALRIRENKYDHIVRSGRNGYRLNEFHHHWYYSVTGSLGQFAAYDNPQDDESLSPKRKEEFSVYPQFNGSFDAFWCYSPHASVGAALDYFYNPHKDNLGRRSYVGLGVKRETIVSHFGILEEVGFYLNGKHPEGESDYTRIYERVGMRYYFRDARSKSPYIGYFIKGNKLTAEQFEITLGYTI